MNEDRIIIISLYHVSDIRSQAGFWSAMTNVLSHVYIRMTYKYLFT